MRPKIFMTPALAKAGKLYSQIGNDFTVVRNLAASFRNASGLLEFAAPNVPRIEFPVGGGCPYLLREAEAENLVPHGLAYTAFGGVLVDNTVTDSPVVGVNSARITKDEAAGNVRFSGQEVLSSLPLADTNYTISRFFKYDGFDLTTTMEGNNALQWGNVSWSVSVIIASTGITLGTPTGCTATIEPLVNGWYHVEVTILTGASPSGASSVLHLFRLGSSLSTGQGFLTAAPQNEIGTEATSYILTTGTPVTRPADVITATDEAGATTNTFVFEDGSTVEEAATGTITIPVGKLTYLKQD